MPENDNWEFKMPESKNCWYDLNTYTDPGCMTAEKKWLIPETLSIDEWQYGFLLISCSANSFTVADGANENIARASSPVVVPYDSSKGYVGCTGWAPEGQEPTLWFTMRAAGWNEKKMAAGKLDERDEWGASGANSLAAAFTAAALMVTTTI